jgi:lysophospholipase L1-like esterase
MNKKRLIGVALLIGLLGYGAFRYYKTYIRPDQIRTRVTSSQYHSYKSNEIYTQPQVDSATMIVGNSLMVEYNMFDLGIDNFQPYAIRGAFTDELLNVKEQVRTRQPLRVIVELGLNDILAGYQPSQVFSNLRQFHLGVEASAQDSDPEVLFVSLPPVNLPWGVFTNSNSINDKVRQTNVMIAEYCEYSSATYVDMYSSLIDDGLLNESYTYDGVHLTEDGYEVWTQVLKRSLGLE